MILLAGIRFLAEIAMLFALGWIGSRLGGDALLLSIFLAVLLPAVAIAVWGKWVAPRARNRLKDPARLSVEVALFGITVAGLVALGQWPWALPLALMYAGSAPAGRAGL